MKKKKFILQKLKSFEKNQKKKAFNLIMIMNNDISLIILFIMYNHKSLRYFIQIPEKFQQ